MNKEQVKRIKEYLDLLYECAESIEPDSKGWKPFNDDREDKRRFSIQRYNWKDDNAWKYYIKKVDFTGVTFWNGKNHIIIDIEIRITHGYEIEHVSVLGGCSHSIKALLENINEFTYLVSNFIFFSIFPKIDCIF